MAKPYDERAARKEYVRARQHRVLKITAALLTVVLLVAVLVYTKVINLEPKRSDIVQPNFGVQTVCAAKNEDGTPMAWATNTQVPVRVLNGTTFRGLANAVGEGLKNRQFNVVTVGNAMNPDGKTYNSKVERTTIYFGEQAINPAYTLARNFTDAQLVMDDRTDRLVDVVVGASFHDLRSLADIKDDGATIKDIEGCVSVQEMQQAGLPKASKHDAYN